MSFHNGSVSFISRGSQFVGCGVQQQRGIFSGSRHYIVNGMKREGGNINGKRVEKLSGYHD
jgi:hypothetical protein